METEQNLELQEESSNNINTNLNKANSDYNYKMAKVVNLIHYRDRIYVPKTFENVF